MERPPPYTCSVRDRHVTSQVTRHVTRHVTRSAGRSGVAGALQRARRRFESLYGGTLCDDVTMATKGLRENGNLCHTGYKSRRKNSVPIRFESLYGGASCDDVTIATNGPRQNGNLYDTGRKSRRKNSVPILKTGGPKCMTSWQDNRNGISRNGNQGSKGIADWPKT